MKTRGSNKHIFGSIRGSPRIKQGHSKNIILDNQEKDVTEKKNFFLTDGRENSEEKRNIDPMQFESGMCPSIVDILVAINDKVGQALGAQNMK